MSAKAGSESKVPATAAATAPLRRLILVIFFLIGLSPFCSSDEEPAPEDARPPAARAGDAKRASLETWNFVCSVAWIRYDLRVVDPWFTDHAVNDLTPLVLRARQCVLDGLVLNMSVAVEEICPRVLSRSVIAADPVQPAAVVPELRSERNRGLTMDRGGI